MATKKSPKFLTTTELCLRLTLPGSDKPLSARNLQKYLERRGIEPKSFKPEGSSYAMNHVTEEQAALVLEDFKLTHWRKFKAAEEKSK